MALVSTVAQEMKTGELFVRDAAKAANPLLLAQIDTPECATLFNLAATKESSALFGADSTQVSEFARAAFKAQENLASKRGEVLTWSNNDIKQNVIHHLNQPNMVCGVHYFLPPGASLASGKGVLLTHQFKDHYLSIADNAGVGGLSVAYQLITNPNDATLIHAMNSYVQYKTEYKTKRTLKRQAHTSLVVACQSLDPAKKSAPQKVRRVYPQIYSAGILPDDSTQGGMTGQLLEHKGVTNTVENRKKVKNVAPEFSPLQQKKWEVLILEAEQHCRLNPDSSMAQCVAAVVNNAKNTNFCLHKDLNNNVYDASTQRTLHFNHAVGFVPGFVPVVAAAVPALPAPSQQ